MKREAAADLPKDVPKRDLCRQCGMENFFGLLKQKMDYGEALVAYEALKQKMEAYINYYNNERIKQKLAGMSPVQYRAHVRQLAA